MSFDLVSRLSCFVISFGKKELAALFLLVCKVCAIWSSSWCHPESVVCNYSISLTSSLPVFLLFRVLGTSSVLSYLPILMILLN